MYLTGASRQEKMMGRHLTREIIIVFYGFRAILIIKGGFREALMADLASSRPF